jgi:hypothetical protein
VPAACRQQLGASVGGLWFWLNTRPFAHRAVRIDATLNRMIAGTAREYLEFVIAAAVGARAPPDYPHTFAAMLTDWIANPLLIQHDTNPPPTNATQYTHAGIVFNRHFEVEGAIVFRQACALGCEGIVSKRLGSPYRSGRADCWVKVKNPAAPAVRREAEEDWGR